MSSGFTPEELQIRDAFARFSDQEITPRAAALDEAHAFPRELFARLGELGFFGMRYPEADGGSGASLAGFCLALEEIARGSMSLAGCAAMQSLMGTKFLHMLGNPDIVERLFRPALRGDKVGAICMTEPNAGSDLESIATTARKLEGGYALNGQKMWVTAAPVADFFTVFAKAGEERKLSIFLVERDSKGLAVGRSIEKMGVWALPTSEVAFNECFVPDTHRLSKVEGDGEGHLRKLLAEIRIITGAMALGTPARRSPLPWPTARAQTVRQADQPLSGDPDEAGRNGHRPEAATHLYHAARPRTRARRTTSRRRWLNCSPAKRRRASATRPRGMPRTAMRWSIRCSVTCATSALR